MSRSIILSEKKSPITAQHDQKEAKKGIFTKWLDEQVLLSFVLLLACAILTAVGLTLWITVPLALFLIVVQCIVYARKKVFEGFEVDIDLDIDEVENSVSIDLYLME